MHPSAPPAAFLSPLVCVFCLCAKKNEVQGGWRAVWPPFDCFFLLHLSRQQKESVNVVVTCNEAHTCARPREERDLALALQRGC